MAFLKHGFSVSTLLIGSLALAGLPVSGQGHNHPKAQQEKDSCCSVALPSALGADPAMTSADHRGHHDRSVASPRGAGHLNVGRRSEIVLSERTRVGDFELPAGRYQVQHRSSGTDHYLSFRQISGSGQPPLFAVKCNVEPLEKKAPQTTARLRRLPDGYRLQNVTIGGENAVHAVLTTGDGGEDN